MSEELQQLLARVGAEVAEPAADWPAFFDDALWLHRFAAGGPGDQAGVFAAIGRVEAVISRLQGGPMHDLEVDALVEGRLAARRAWLRTKGERKGWSAEEVAFMQRAEEEFGSA